jgi:regulator of ribosome biosynthesis
MPCRLFVVTQSTRHLPASFNQLSAGVRTCRSDYSGQLEFDVGNLSAYDPSHINQEEYAPLHRDAKCLEVATVMTQALVGQLFSLPSEAVQGGRLAQLPQPSTLLPREKPIPKPKPLTKWQKFAQVSRRTQLESSAC